MIFTMTPLPDAWVIEPTFLNDERGFFARTWCREEFARRGLNSKLVQSSISFNRRRGTLRGMHFQAPPHAETKLVRCTQGAIFDVIVDLRPGSTASQKWFGLELTASNRRQIYIPEGCAHGFITLEDNTEVFYQISDGYVPQAARGVRWDDPAFAIRWPIAPTIISERDRNYPDWMP